MNELCVYERLYELRRLYVHEKLECMFILLYVLYVILLVLLPVTARFCTGGGTISAGS